MIKKTISYIDYDGNERKEDFYFNLSKTEIAKMNLKVTGGLAKMINKIIEAQNTAEITDLFCNIIDMSYGVKSADGKRFMKNPELLAEFKETEAYSILFMDLATDADKAAEFINGVVPEDVAEEASKIQQNNLTALPDNK